MEPEGIAPASARLDAPPIARATEPPRREARSQEHPVRIDREALDAKIAAANEELAALDRDLRFAIHDKSGEMIVEIVDTKTGEVLREQPSRKFLDLIVRLREMVGLFLDARS